MWMLLMVCDATLANDLHNVSFILAVNDHQPLSQQEKEERLLFVSDNKICVYVCVCLAVSFMHGKLGMVQAKTKHNPSKNKESDGGKHA